VSHPNIAHWDDVEEHDFEAGRIHSWWRFLGEATGTVGIGVNRVRVAPGSQSTPLHMEGEDEEHFYVLSGSGLSWQRRGEEDLVCEVGAGDCIVNLPRAEAHTLVAGPDGLEFVVFGTRSIGDFGYFPRLGKMRMGPSLFEVDRRHQWDLEGELPPPELTPGERPKNVVRLEDVEPDVLDRGDFGDSARAIGEAGGSVRAGLHHSQVPPGKLNCPVHCHAAEEEFFVVLDGNGVCILGDDEHPVRAGSVVARPPRSRVGHAFRGGENGLTMLVYGTREPNDIAWYPRSRKVYLRGIGLVARIEQLGYWDGEG
jgi:uncharacterized cupin superfamily protein